MIVGERGPSPRSVPTFPELTCHSLEDLRMLDEREKTGYSRVRGGHRRRTRSEVIPYWRGRSLRDRIFEALPPEWRDAYEAGIFTEFMEQRAPGHTVADGKIYRKGMLDFKADIERGAGGRSTCWATRRRRGRAEQLRAMDIAADALIVFAAAARGAWPRELAAAEEIRPARRRNSSASPRSAAGCRRTRRATFHEALQMYWFCHLAVITELNGWDAF